MFGSTSRSSAVALVLLLLGCPSLVTAAGDPGDSFGSPPADTRILKIIHNWPDEAEAQDGLIAQLVRQGFGGVVCNVSFEGYLQSEAKWRAFVRAEEAARKSGMALWLYDERGYPSGNAGGLVLRDHPEWEAEGLLIIDAASDGKRIELAVPPGSLLTAAAFPERDGVIAFEGRTDLAGTIRGGRLEWTPPAGRWHAIVITRHRLYEGTHAEGNLAEKMPYVNLLRPEPTRKFLELTHQQYARRFGADLGRHFVSTFTDEPSLMSWFLKPMPYRVLPWAPALADEFRRRRGYALEPVLPNLVLEAGGPGARNRYDYWLTVGELVSENFFGQIQDWCRGHNIASGGHLLMEESLTSHVPLYGDLFRCARRLDAPSIDCLTSLPPDVPWWIARLLASAAEVEGKSIVMSETSDHAQRYRPPGDARPVRTVTEAEIRGTCHRLIAGGVNCITSYYSFAGLSDDAIRRLNEEVGRCCAMLRGGHQAADIALVYPIESVWPRFVPSRETTREAHEAAAVESIFQAAMESLFRARREFTIVDSRAVRESRVAGDSLEHGASRWKVVILPAADTLPLAAWENLARFVRQGGVAIALGGLPRNSEVEFPCPSAQALARDLFGDSGERPRALGNPRGGGGIYLPAGSESLLPIVLSGVLAPDVVPGDRNAPLRATHRRIDGHEVYFVINDSPRPWRGPLSVASRGDGRRWDPATGMISNLSGAMPIDLSLEPYGATLLRFSQPPAPARRRLTSGDLPNLTERPLPLEVPVAAHGEFVRAEVAPEAGVAGGPVTRYRADATLTRAKVDTFLFLRFHARSPLGLSADDCLVIDSWLPEGQRTANRLLVILHEEGGGDFLATTSRGLGRPGHERTFVPLNQFQHAAWTQDSDGVLDLTRVSDVSVGWGGYLGAEGEPVRFDVTPPMAGSTAAQKAR